MKEEIAQSRYSTNVMGSVNITTIFGAEDKGKIIMRLLITQLQAVVVNHSLIVGLLVGLTIACCQAQATMM